MGSQTNRDEGASARLRRARLAARLTQSQAAEIIGVSRGSIAQYERGRTEPPPGAIEKLQRLSLPGPNRTSIVDDPTVPVTYPPQPMRYAGLVPAGNWGDPLDSETFVEVDPRIWHRDRFGTRVIGDSCFPALQPDDFTVWHMDRNVKFGIIVLAQQTIEHSCTVKVLNYDDKQRRPVLEPLNPAYDPPEDGHGWEVIARLVYVERNVDGMVKTYYMPTGIRPEHLL